MSTRLHIVVSDELRERIDQERGDVPRSAWLRRVIEREVGRADSNRRAVEQALEVAGKPSSDAGTVSRGSSVGSVALEPDHAAGSAVASGFGVEGVGREGIPAPAEQPFVSAAHAGGEANRVAGVSEAIERVYSDPAPIAEREPWVSDVPPVSNGPFG